MQDDMSGQAILVFILISILDVGVLGVGLDASSSNPPYTGFFFYALTMLDPFLLVTYHIPDISVELGIII